MQINKSWAGKTIAGIHGPIDFERVQKEWDYNVDVGKAIFDEATRQANDFFRKLGVTPTAEQPAKESYFLYNHSPGFWKYKLVNGQKVRDRRVEFHYWEKDPITGQIVKKDYSKDPDFNKGQRKGATQSQKRAERHWDNLRDKVWETNPPC